MKNYKELSYTRRLLVATNLIHANKLTHDPYGLTHLLERNFLLVNIGKKGLVSCGGYKRVGSKVKTLLEGVEGLSSAGFQLASAVEVGWLLNRGDPNEFDELFRAIHTNVPGGEAKGRCFALVTDNNLRGKALMERHGYTRHAYAQSPFSDNILAVYLYL